LLLTGKYQTKPDLPFSPGGEAAGIVTETGVAVQGLKVGDRVMIASSHGFLRSEVVVGSYFALKIPPGLSLNEASASWFGWMTAYHGLVQRGSLKTGETLLVTGAAGGMGVFAIQLAKAMGCVVVAAASSPEKLAVCKRLGADHLIDYSQQNMKDEVNKITNGKGVDVCYELVGSDVFDACTRCVGRDGRLLVVGFAGGRIPSLPANLPLIKGYSVVGVTSGMALALNPRLGQEARGALAEAVAKGWRPFIGHIVPVAEFRNAFFLLHERRALGKCVIEWEREAPARL